MAQWSRSLPATMEANDMLPRVLCTLPLPEPFGSLVSPHAEIVTLGAILPEEELAAAVGDIRPAVLVPQLRDAATAQVIEAGLPELHGVATYAVGFNNVDRKVLRDHGLVLANTPDVLTAATADCALALMLAVARRVVEGDRIMREDSFAGWAPDYLLGMELNSAVLGIVGFGRIGQAVARRAQAFGMSIIYVPHHAGAECPQDLKECCREVTLQECYTTADVLSLHAPLTAETRHLINGEVLRSMKRNAILVNTARGPLVDEDALATALEEGWIWGAGLDVFEDEPHAHPRLRTAMNAVLLPHVGSATGATRSRMAEVCARNVLAILEGTPPPHPVVLD